MNVYAVGLRGIPQVQGGIETHAEQLYPRLVQRGVQVTVLGRTPYVPRRSSYQGVHVVRLWNPQRPGLEAFVHTLLGVLYAGLRRPDLLHVHAVGPALFVPLARLLGLRVVFTHHGEDYKREKWGRFARGLLRLGERLGCRFSCDVIVISEPIRAHVSRMYGIAAHCIPNGLPRVACDFDPAIAPDLAVRPGRYVLSVARVVPEKRQLDLIAAYAKARGKAPEFADMQLLLVGSADTSEPYGRAVIEAAGACAGVIMGGFRKGPALAALFRNSSVFCLPSSHEGHPIALLEALAYGAPVVASDIAANRAIGLPGGCYVPVGGIDELADALIRASNHPEEFRPPNAAELLRRYDWEAIADQTLGVFASAMPLRRDGGQRSRNAEG